MDTGKIIGDSSTELLQLGVAGVFIIALVFALVIVWRQLQKKDAQLDAEKDGRLQDAKDFTNQIKPALQEQRELAVKQTELTQKVYESILSNNKGA